MYVVASRAFETKYAARAVVDMPINLKNMKLKNLRKFGSVSAIRLEPKPKRNPAILLAKFEADVEIYRAPIHSILKIQEMVAEFYNVKMNELISPRREARLVLPRHVAMWLAKELTSRSIVDIGRRFGRDHTTALSAIRRITQKRLVDRELCDEISELESILMNGDKA